MYSLFSEFIEDKTNKKNGKKTIGKKVETKEVDQNQFRSVGEKNKPEDPINPNKKKTKNNGTKEYKSIQIIEENNYNNNVKDTGTETGGVEDGVSGGIALPHTNNAIFTQEPTNENFSMKYAFDKMTEVLLQMNNTMNNNMTIMNNNMNNFIETIKKEKEETKKELLTIVSNNQIGYGVGVPTIKNTNEPALLEHRRENGMMYIGDHYINPEKRKRYRNKEIEVDITDQLTCKQKEVAYHLNISESSLSKKFKECTQHTKIENTEGKLVSRRWPSLQAKKAKDDIDTLLTHIPRTDPEKISEIKRAIQTNPEILKSEQYLEKFKIDRVIADKLYVQVIYLQKILGKVVLKLNRRIVIEEENTNEKKKPDDNNNDDDEDEDDEDDEERERNNRKKLTE